MMKAKMECCPYNSELWIYDGKKKLVEIVFYNCETKIIKYLKGNVMELGKLIQQKVK